MPLTAFHDGDGTLLGVHRSALPEDAPRARIKQLSGLDA